MKPEDLSQVVAIVTGAAGGLGAAMTEALVDGGARVLAVDVHRGALDALAGRLPAGRVAPHAADIRDDGACRDIVAHAAAAFGEVYALVNNAGIGQSSIRASYYVDRIKFWEVTEERWRAIMDTNAMAPFLLAKAILPHLTAAGWGRIVNVTTSLDTMTRPGWTPYGPSKAALEACTAIWAGDLEGSGITVNVLVPGGPANTAMVPPDSSPDRAAMIQPEAMAAPIRWLLDPASDGVTGRRFLGVRWDPSLPPEQAAEAASAPAAWPGLGQQARWPGQAGGE
ncbi:MAG: SDR family NAD(P)-dependent oxidoreductase [Defluviicoccus sp.]|nr:SDR family NAD(P)-dependent oxidoreductase [Defluviicoccus sp.]MDE0383286.1 SDR family NAD(P)-dependent oxidoreductase [Defluviicoccus sp.]